MSRRNSSLVGFILVYNLFCLAVAFLTDTKSKGLFLGSIVIIILFFYIRKGEHIIKYSIIIFLYVNLLMTINNGILYSGYVIPPLLPGDGVYNSNIIRMLEIGSLRYPIRRPTGISDNIHVASLLNLYLCYWLSENNKKIQFIIVVAAVITGLNVQIILVLIVWLVLKHFIKKPSPLLIVLIILLAVISLYFIDYFVLGGSYMSMITNTIGPGLYYEWEYYYKLFDLYHISYGIKAGTVEDPYNRIYKAIPLTDIGLFGIPLQHGVLGMISIFMLFYLWFKYASSQLRLFIMANLIGVIHYFPMISLPGILVMTWLVRESCNKTIE